jgi:hypothetical protein
VLLNFLDIERQSALWANHVMHEMSSLDQSLRPDDWAKEQLLAFLFAAI